MPSRESSEAGDVTARVCAWAGHLEEMGRQDEARQVLREALDSPGDPVPVALTLAALEDRAGATARAAELLRKVLGDDPGNLSAARMLAMMMLDEGKPTRRPGWSPALRAAPNPANLQSSLGRSAWRRADTRRQSRRSVCPRRCRRVVGGCAGARGGTAEDRCAAAPARMRRPLSWHLQAWRHARRICLTRRLRRLRGQGG